MESEIIELTEEQFSKGIVPTEGAAPSGEKPTEEPPKPLDPPATESNADVDYNKFINEKFGVESADKLKEKLTYYQALEAQADQDDDEEIVELKQWKKKGQPLDKYFDIKKLDVDKLDEKSVLWKKFTLEHEGMPENQLRLLFENKYKKSYETEDLDGEEAELAKAQLSMDVLNAKKFLNKYKEENLKFDTEGVRSRKDKAKELADYYQKHVERTNDYMKQFTKAEYKAKDVDEAFNFALDGKIDESPVTRAQRIEKILKNPLGEFGELIADEKGDPSFDKMKTIAPFLADPNGFINEMIQFGINIGKKQLVEKKANATVVDIEGKAGDTEKSLYDQMKENDF